MGSAAEGDCCPFFAVLLRHQGIFPPQWRVKKRLRFLWSVHSAYTCATTLHADFNFSST